MRLGAILLLIQGGRIPHWLLQLSNQWCLPLYREEWLKGKTKIHMDAHEYVFGFQKFEYFMYF
jgi:hypothetical protein